MADRMDVAPPCKTCGHWEQAFPDNLELGRCSKVWVTLWPNRVAISASTARETRPDYYPDVTTRAEFGCRYHTDFVQMGL